jgi:DME family drug/metabolite transporter
MGMVWSALVALSYAAMNLCLRAAALQVDPLVASLIRGVPMLLLAWGMIAAQRQTQQVTRLGWRVVLPLMLAAVILSVVGNGSYQAGLTYAGLTITVPVTAGASLWGGAFGGWWLMREGVSAKSIVGLLVLVVALPLLISGGGGGLGPIWLGTLAAVIAGLSYGGGSVLLRRTMVTHQHAQPSALAVIATTGMIANSALVLARQGLVALTVLDHLVLTWLLIAGLFNALATVAQLRALALLPVSRVGALGALQTALSALGGVIIFAEPLTLSIALGLALSLIGAVLSQRGASERPTAAKNQSSGRT